MRLLIAGAGGAGRTLIPEGDVRGRAEIEAWADGIAREPNRMPAGAAAGA